MMGFGAGVMVAASCWSLLVPAIEAVATLGFLAGFTVMMTLDNPLG